MKNTIVTHPTFNQVFKAWLIRTYLKVHMLLFIVIVKATPVIFFIIRDKQFSIIYILYIFLFFYFELYICYRYFEYKKKFLKIHHRLFSDETLRFEQDEIIIKTDLFEHKIIWNNITGIKENRWFIFIMKGNETLITFNKFSYDQHQLEILKHYLFMNARDRSNIKLEIKNM